MEISNVFFIIFVVLCCLFEVSFVCKIIRALFFKPFQHKSKVPSKIGKNIKVPSELVGRPLLLFGKNFFAEKFFVTDDEEVRKFYIENGSKASFISVEEYDSRIDKINATLSNWAVAIRIIEAPVYIALNLVIILFNIIVLLTDIFLKQKRNFLRMKYPNATEYKIDLAMYHGEDYLKQ